MKKGLWFLFMLLLAGCGSGGSSPTADNSTPAVSGTSATGLVSIQFTESGAALQKSVASLPATSPGRARIVLTESTLKFRKVVDIAFGATPGSISLPVGSYSVKAIWYSKGTPNELSHFGVVAGLVTVTANNATDLILGMTKIADALTTPTCVLSTPTDVYSGASYTVGPNNEQEIATFNTSLADCGLQPKWSLAVSTAPLSRSHLAQAPSTTHLGLIAPAVGQQGFLYFQGEFFMTEDLLDAGEVATDWTFVVEPAAATLKVSSATPPSGLPSDDKAPEIISFYVPVATQGTNRIAPISITAVDNAEIAGYLIKETADAPNIDDVWSVNMPTYHDYSIAPTGTNVARTLYAWVKDPSGNVSLAVDKVTNKTVTLNNSPVVNRFTVTTAVQFDRTDIPITAFAGSEFLTTSTDLQYLVTESTQTPDVGAAGWSSIPPLSHNVTSITQSTGVRYTVPLYGWVKDGDNRISAYAKSNVVICDIPQITSFTAFPLTVLTGSEVKITNLDANTASGAINGYLITTGIKPVVADFAGKGTEPTSFTYPGLPAGVATSKYLYAWVKDENDRISLSKTVYVRFSNP